MIELTELAAREVKTIIQRQKESDNGDAKAYYLRLGVKGGGCSGLSYTLNLTETKTDRDHLWPFHGIDVICDPKSFIHLDGSIVDFKDEVMGRGFVFSNPKAKSTCGCGSSFQT